jgi:hypothetical protein
MNMRLFSTLVFNLFLLIVVGLKPAMADEFCDLTSGEFLSELNGNWNVTHSPGVTLVPQIGLMPFPAPKDSSINLEYMPDLGLSFAEGLESPGQMIVMTAEGNQQGLAEIVLENKGANREPESCGWTNSPVVVGTTNYPDLKPGSDFGQHQDVFCDNVIHASMMLDMLGLPSGIEEFMKSSPGPNYCKELAGSPKISSSEMTMMMFVKFSGPDSGSGRLFFSGQVNGYDFQAITPIALSR